MDEKELLQFLTEILKNNNTQGAQLAMGQLCQILDRSGVNKDMVDKVSSFIKYSKEMRETLYNLTNRDLTQEDMDIAIQRGKRREQEEYEARNRGRC